MLFDTVLGCSLRPLVLKAIAIFPQALCGSQYLVGDQLSCADIHLLEATLMMEEKFPEILKHFPNVEVNLMQLRLR